MHTPTGTHMPPHRNRCMHKHTHTHTGMFKSIMKIQLCIEGIDEMIFIVWVSSKGKTNEEGYGAYIKRMFAFQDT